jgi:hypothetical protein
VQIASPVERELGERFMVCEAKRNIFPTTARFLTEFPLGFSRTNEPFQLKRVDLIGAMSIYEDWDTCDDITAKQTRLRLKTTNPVEFIKSIVEGPIWLLEIKKVLDQKAIGQVLADKSLLEEDLVDFYEPNLYELEVKMGIICGKTDRLLEQTCRNYNINVFIV